MLVLELYRSCTKVIGRPITKLGYRLECLGAALENLPKPEPWTGYEKEIREDENGYEYDFYPTLELPDPQSHFNAPTASVAEGYRFKPRSAVWYHATIEDASSQVGMNSSILEFAKIEKSAKVGEKTVVGPFANIKRDAVIGSGVSVGAWAVVSEKAVVEDSVIIGEGSVVAPGQVLKSGKLYAGNAEGGAEEIRDLDEVELAELTEGAKTLARRANYHATEWSKSALLVDLERIAVKDRKFYAETVREDLPRGSRALVHGDQEPDHLKYRRGLIYDK